MPYVPRLETMVRMRRPTRRTAGLSAYVMSIGDARTRLAEINDAVQPVMSELEVLHLIIECLQMGDCRDALDFVRAQRQRLAAAGLEGSSYGVALLLAELAATQPHDILFYLRPYVHLLALGLRFNAHGNADAILTALALVREIARLTRYEEVERFIGLFVGRRTRANLVTPDLPGVQYWLDTHDRLVQEVEGMLGAPDADHDAVFLGLGRYLVRLEAGRDL